MKKQNGNILLVLVLLLAIVAAGFWWFMKGDYKSKLNKVEPTPSPITTTSGLDSANKELDSTDLNKIDAELNVLGTESASF